MKLFSLSSQLIVCLALSAVAVSSASGRPCEREDFSKYTGNYSKSLAFCQGIHKVYPCDGFGEISGGEITLDSKKKPSLTIEVKAPKSVVPGRKDNRLFVFDSGDKAVECGEAGGHHAIRFKSKKKEATLTHESDELIRFKQSVEVKDKGRSRKASLEVGFAPLK